MKANYRVPEIWMALDTPDHATEAAGVLRAAGLSVVTCPSDAVTASPSRVPVSAFALDGDGLRLATAAGDPTLGYDAFWLIAFTPKGDATGVPHGFADAFVIDPPRRYGIVAGSTDFAGLGSEHSPSALGNLTRFVQECDRRMPAGRVDHRLLHMHLRQPRLSRAVPASGCQRKGYSYASSGLENLLEQLDPEMVSIGQPELSVRLAYATCRYR